VSADYQPAWLRLSEARASLMSSLSLSESEAEAWILRAIQDQLRVDPERYNAQTTFQVQGFPTQWKRRRIPLDWPARLTPDRIDWEASTIYGPDPFRLIDNNLFIEIKTSALAPAAPPSSASTVASARFPGDATLIEEGRRMVVSGMQKRAVARQLAARAEGAGTFESKVDRLRKLL
jgi:hypothetical protein